MAGSKGEGRSVLYYGCVGCGALVLLAVLAVAGLAGLAWMQVGQEQVEERDVVRPVEAPAAAEAPPGPGDGPEAVPRVGVPTTAAAGTVVVEVAESGFTLRPGEPGEGVRVQAKYDTKSYALEQEESTAEDGTWVYRVAFRRTGGFLVGIKELLGGTPPKVVIYLPPDAPIRLRLDVETGGGSVDLGGLWLTDVEVDFSKGGFSLECGEPNRVPVDRFVVDGSMGGLAMEGIANLAPREIDVSMRMGGAALDLTGEWPAGATVRLSNRMGGMAVALPAGVPVRGIEGAKVRGSIEPPASPETPGPVLDFTLSGDLEDIEFARE